MSAPVRMPPSNGSWMSEPTASAIAGNAEIEDGAPSSWRPPWFDTTMASAPSLTAVLASSASRMPLRISLPGQIFLIHSTSFQLSAGSNCSPTHLASWLTFSMPCTWPARLPKVLRLPLRMLHAQAGLLATSMIFLRRISGGTVMPFLMCKEAPGGKCETCPEDNCSPAWLRSTEVEFLHSLTRNRNVAETPVTPKSTWHRSLISSYDGRANKVWAILSGIGGNGGTHDESREAWPANTHLGFTGLLGWACAPRNSMKNGCHPKTTVYGKGN